MFIHPGMLVDQESKRNCNQSTDQGKVKNIPNMGPWARSHEGLSQAKPKPDNRKQKGQLSQSLRVPGGAIEWKLRNVSQNVLSPEADEWTWTKLSLAIKVGSFWSVLDGWNSSETAVHYSLFLSISSSLHLSFTWHIFKWRKYNSMKNKAEFNFVLNSALFWATVGKVLTFHKVRAGINLPDDLAPMRTINSTVLIVQKVFR